MGNGGFSPNVAPAHSNAATSGTSDGTVTANFGGPTSPMPLMQGGEGMASIGLTPFTSGSEAATLPQFWAEMFGIKLDGDQTLAM
jgi:hypothetical protein